MADNSTICCTDDLIRIVESYDNGAALVVCPRYVAELALAEIEALRAQVARGDALLAAVKAKAQAESSAEYQAEFGHNGPSLAGLPGIDSTDRTYIYYRHQLSDQFPHLPNAMTALGQRR